MIGIHANNEVITANDGRTTNTNYMDFLLTLGTVAFYDMDASVASLLHKIELTEEEGIKLRDKSKLNLVIANNTYSLTYYPGKFFSIYRGDKVSVYCYNCKQFMGYSDDKTPLECAQRALKVAHEVLASYKKIGIDSKSLISPISAFVKAGRYPKTVTLEDLPEEVAKLSYDCMQGNWVETYKLGSFPVVYDYDIRGAYGYELTQILDTRRGAWIQDTCKPEGSVYGFAKGKLNIDSPFSPFLFGNGDMRYTPTGNREVTITQQEWEFLLDYKLGASFECYDAWWWIPEGPQYNPFKGVVTYLSNLRKDVDPLTNSIIKRVIAGIWGYCSQTKGTTNLSFGDYFSPVVAAVVETNCRLKVARTILDNDLFPYLINIAVDGIVTTKEMPVGNGEMGSWRLTHQGKGLAVSSGIVGIEGKSSEEEFSVTYDKLIDMFASNPDQSEYTMEKYSPCTFAKAMNEKDLSRLGVVELANRTIKIEPDVKRIYKERPVTGGDLLNNTYESTPVDISILEYDFSDIKTEASWE